MYGVLNTFDEKIKRQMEIKLKKDETSKLTSKVKLFPPHKK